MRKTLVYLISLVSSLVVLSPAAVFAVAAPATANSQAQAQTETTSQRVEKNKTKFAVKLTDAETSKIKSKCKASQVIGKALNAQITKKNKTRTETYSTISTKITEAITSLKEEGKDVTTLESQSKELSQKIEKYKTDVAAYQVAITDLSEVDCAVDPTGFKAALEASREARKTVAEDVLVIKTYINTNIKKTLKELDETKASTTTTQQQTSTGDPQ